MNYYVGDFKTDAREGGKRGWIVGSFMEEGTPQKTDKMEVKYWEFEEGIPDHPTKISSTFEVCFILSGELEGQIDGQPLKLIAGQYVVIPPGISNNTVEKVLKRATGITIKTPSDPRAKKVISGV